MAIGGVISGHHLLVQLLTMDLAVLLLARLNWQA